MVIDCEHSASSAHGPILAGFYPSILGARYAPVRRGIDEERNIARLHRVIENRA